MAQNKRTQSPEHSQARADFYVRLDPERARLNVPHPLRDLPVWLSWKELPPRPGDKKPGKVPYYFNGLVRRDTETPEDRASLVTFERILEAYDPKRYAGIAVALGRVPGTELQLSGIDLDECVADDRTVAPEAQQVIDAARGAYTEISPGRHGIKIIGLGDIGTLASPQLEIYSQGRFFTITGDRIAGNGRLVDLSTAAALARQVFERPHGQGKRRAAKDRVEASGPIPDGQRNNTIFRYACSLRGQGIAKDTAWALVQERNEECQPPLDRGELKRTFGSAWEYPAEYRLTDLGNAERLVDLYGDDFRFVPELRQGWISWRLHCWTPELGEQFARNRATTMIRRMYVEAAELAAKGQGDKHSKLIAHALRCESVNRIEAMLKLAESLPPVVVQLRHFDTNPWLIGLQNGVFDLDKQEFRPGRRDDLILKHMNISFDPKARCPRWEKFQTEIHGGSKEMAAFKQRLWGYTASGDASEEKFFLCTGDGSNGKSTEMEVMGELFGDYGLVIEPDTIGKKDRPRADNAASSDIAEMAGRRLLRTSELEEGHQLAEQLIKRLTGRDTIAARMLYAERMRFGAIAKLFISTNHKPSIRGTDHAIWRRVVVVPYPVRFSPDKALREKLIVELPGIFNWMAAGFAEWRMHGLGEPTTVVSTSVQYRSDQDRVGQFLKERVNYGPMVPSITRANHLYAAYSRWILQGGMKPLSNRNFYEHLERDHNLHRSTGRFGPNTVFKNLELLSVDHGNDAEDIDA